MIEITRATALCVEIIRFQTPPNLGVGRPIPSSFLLPTPTFIAVVSADAGPSCKIADDAYTGNGELVEETWSMLNVNPHQGDAHGRPESTDREDSATSRAWVHHVLEVILLFVRISLRLTPGVEACFPKITSMKVRLIPLYKSPAKLNDMIKVI
jgi:hypothetical protein